MYEFIGWKRSHNSAIPLMRDVRKGYIFQCGFTQDNKIIIPAEHLNKHQEFPSKEIYETVEEVFSPSWQFPHGESPAFSRFSAPLSYSVTARGISITVERDYRKYAHQPCMSSDLIEYLGYEQRPRTLHSSIEVPEWATLMLIRNMLEQGLFLKRS